MGEAKQRAVVLLSGGMDSCVCAALARRDHGVGAVHISYGQRTEQRERLAFERICERLEISDRLLVRPAPLQAVGGPGLTDDRIAVPGWWKRKQRLKFRSPMCLFAMRTF